MPEIWGEVGVFIKSFLLRWVNLVGGAGFAVFCIFYTRTTGKEPPVTSLWILAACLVVASFLAWRDEHLRVKSKALRTILNRIADKTKDVPVDGVSAGRRIASYDAIGALIDLSDEFGSEIDVETVCGWLKRSNTYDPFEYYELEMGVIGAFKGKRLAFLQDARAKHNCRIKTNVDAIAFIRTFWADEHGLWDCAIFPARIVNGMPRWEREMCRPISAARAKEIYLCPPAVPEGQVARPISTPPDFPRKELLPEHTTRRERDAATVVVPVQSGRIPVAKIPPENDDRFANLLRWLR